MWADALMAIHLKKCCVTNAERSAGSVSEVRVTPQWKLHAASLKSVFQYTTHLFMLAHTGDREAPHIGFIRGYGFLQHSTMGSSPNCYNPALSISQPVFGRGCTSHFSSYHRQTSSPRPGHTPSSPIKQSHLGGQTCLVSIGWPRHTLLIHIQKQGYAKPSASQINCTAV